MESAFYPAWVFDGLFGREFLLGLGNSGAFSFNSFGFDIWTAFKSPSAGFRSSREIRRENEKMLLNKSKIIFSVLVVGAAAVLLFLLFGGQDEKLPALALDSFARCLTEKNIVMYGADWCPHCQNEKKAFGEAFQFISYVECPQDPKKCLDAGVNGYPTWIFSDGRKLEGEQGVEKLSRESGCLLETNN